MENFGIHSGLLFMQALNCLVPLIWIGLSLTALYGLRKRDLSETTVVLWAILICVVPILGAIAFWIISPSGHHKDGVG